MNDILNTTNIIELHQKLSEFAIHHQKKGVEQAVLLIDNKISELKSMLKSGNPKDVIRDEAIDETLIMCKNLLVSVLLK